MKKLMLGAVICLLAAWLGAADLNWMTDLDKALAKAKAEKKLVMLNFTGSDWCGWCKKLDAEVFSTEQFKSYAEKNLVLVLVDFPRKELPAAQKKANEALKAKYGVKGYPSIIVLNSQGEKVFEQVGFKAGLDFWLGELDKAKNK